MKPDWKKLIISILLPNAIGALATLITGGGSDYESYVKPPLSPPGIVFPIVWTILFVMMGISLYLVWVNPSPEGTKKEAYVSFALQLFANFMWTVVFFGLQLLCVSFAVLAALWILIIANIYFFSKVNKTAAYLLIPYLLWVTFAGYLNLSVCLLNG